MIVPLWAWVSFNAFVLVVLALDLGVWHRKARVIGAREAALWTVAWVVLALLFAGGLALHSGPQTGLTFLTGYVIEETLSADNVFVIALIFSYFHVPPAYQHRVLFWGVIGALVMRGAFIGAGVYLLARFAWLEYALGVVLLVAAVRMLRQRGADLAGSSNAALRVLQRILPVRSTMDGQKLIARDPGPGGSWVATPLLVALVLIEASDLAFAMDSIPAIFAVTRDPFLVYTSNVFALLGLRSLYFVLAAAIQRFRLLPHGLALVLALVGIKMLLAAVVAIPTGIVLGVIVLVLGVAVWKS